MSKASKELQTMANMLRQGATLTKHSCPACSSPLFKLKSGELWCAKCEKRVVILGDEERSVHTRTLLLTDIESTILTKLQQLEVMIKQETDNDKLSQLLATLSALLENLERINRLRK